MSMFEAIRYHKERLKIRNITKESMNLLVEVLKILDRIEPIDETDHVHSFWLYVKRDSFDTWKEENDTKKKYKNYSEKSLMRAFKRQFNKEAYWINVHASYNDRYNFKLLQFGGFCIDINAVEDHHCFEEQYESDVTGFLQWFKVQVIRLIDGIKDGSYNMYTAQKLPYTYRFGTICRNVYWEYFPEDKEYMLRGLTKEEIDRFVSFAENQGDNFVPEKRIKDVTFMQYFTWAATAYRAAKYDIFTDNVATLFFRYGEDFGSNVLRKLDYNSVKDFDDYYRGRCGAVGGHPWGIRRGSSRTRITLCPVYDGDGYYFELLGDQNYMVRDMVKMYLALNDLGLPLKLGMPKEMADYLLERDLIGLCPNPFLQIYSYRCYGDRCVSDDRVYRNDRRSKYFNSIDWVPITELKSKVEEEL